MRSILITVLVVVLDDVECWSVGVRTLLCRLVSADSPPSLSISQPWPWLALALPRYLEFHMLHKESEHFSKMIFQKNSRWMMINYNLTSFSAYGEKEM